MLSRLLTGTGLLVLVAVLLWVYGNAREKVGRLAERAEWTAQHAQFERKAAEVTRSHIEQARAVERRQAEAAERIAHDAANDVARWRAAVERLRSADQADPDTPGATHLPNLAYAALDPDGAGSGALVSIGDLETCGENTLKAQAWQDWWRATLEIK